MRVKVEVRHAPDGRYRIFSTTSEERGETLVVVAVPTAPATTSDEEQG